MESTSRHWSRSPRSAAFAIGLFLVSFALLGTTAGCSTTKGAADTASRAAANALLPAREEEKLGDQFSRDVEKELALHEDKSVTSYISKLGNQVVKAAGDDVPKGIEFEFHVVDDPETINAFAGPGGQIYFYSGLLRKADDTAEVMAVMAHEVAHVTERHVARRLVAAYGLDSLSSAALGENPGLVGKLASTLVAQGFLLKYSRDHERQADSVGFEYMTKTAYNPRGFVSFFEKLQGGPSPPTFLSSHPNPSERIQTLKQKIAAGKNLPTKNGREEHAKIVKRL